jgi:formiminotetrahydrofolate cyclodeaminase
LPLLDLIARELLDRFASAEPTPGGGSAAALAGALGAALAERLGSTSVTNEDADVVGLLQEAGDEPAAEPAGGAGDEGGHGPPLRVGRGKWSLAVYPES